MGVWRWEAEVAISETLNAKSQAIRSYAWAVSGDSA